jgi:two-component system, sensor histidine kinase
MLIRMSSVSTSNDRLLHEQVRLLARNVPALVVGTLVLSSGTAALLVMNGQPPRWVLYWLAAMAALCAIRWWGAVRYRRAQPGPSQAPGWARWFVLASFVAGVLWGSLTALFFSPDDPHTQAVLVMILVAIVASATQSLGSYFPAHLAFAVPALVPFAVRSILSGDARTMTLGVLGLVFLMMAELFARRIALAIEEALRLRFENDALVVEVSRARDTAEAASQAKTRFLATASHDLRQPIHAMSMFVPALKRMAQEGRLSATALGDISDRMQSALDNMGQLLNRLLDVSRLDADAVRVNKEDFPLEPLLSAVVDEVSAQAEGKGLRLRMHDGGLWVHSDPSVLHTMLSNLVSNAVRYTDRGGVLVSARSRGDSVDIQIWDTGIGISARELSRITEEFYQGSNAHVDRSQSRGFGLGLAIVHRSAQLIGVRLGWRSELGRGSMFSIQAPRARFSHEPSPPPFETPPSSRTGACNVLVVEENQDILAAMTFLLKSWGHVPLQASNAKEATRIALAHGNDLDAALIDFHLTRDINGLEVAHLLRQHVKPDLAMAIVTGDTSAEVMNAVLAAGLAVMHKPVNPAELQQFIARAR